jgi:cytochrome P450
MTRAMPRAVIHDDDPPPPPMPDPLPRDSATIRLGDLLDQPGYPDNLYDLLAASGRPAAYADDYRLWVVHRHADVLRALTDTGDEDSAYSNALTLIPVGDICEDAGKILAKLKVPATTAGADNPDHARTVRALRATFPNTATKVADQYGDVVDRRVDQLTEYVRSRTRDMHTVDLAADFANLLPLWVICDLLGVSSVDMDRIKAWADGQIALVWGQPDDAEQVRLAQGLLDFWTWTQAHIARREDERLAGRPGGDWVGAVLRWRDVNGGDTALTMAEVASLAFNLLVAGHETTAGLIAHCLDSALSDSVRWRALGADPTLVPEHVERTLRCRPPIDGWLRLAKRDIHLDGATIPAGARVLCLLGAANREDAELLSFGHGAHYCVGAALARLEAERALTALTARVPGLRLAPNWRRAYEPNVAFRHHANLLAVVA